MSEIAKAILHALGYTPKTLASDIGVSIYQARRILSKDGTLYLNEIFAICNVTDITPNTLCGLFVPGDHGKGSDVV